MSSASSQAPTDSAIGLVNTPPQSVITPRRGLTDSSDCRTAAIVDGMSEVTRRFNVRIPLRDGITLSADLTLPGPLPAPAVVIRTPYGKSGEPQSKRGSTFGAAGYATVVVDVRGRGDSDGQFQPYRNDGPDGFDVIGWVAAQDWCT